MNTIRARLLHNPFLLALIVAATAVVCSVIFTSNHAYAADCSNNSIIRCGASNPSDFINKVNQNSTQDLQAIYADYGLTPDEYGRFVASARYGTSYRDGRIVVDGRTVATNSKSIGRTQFSYSHARKIGAGQVTFWESRTTDVQKSDMPVMVMFNDKGEFEFAVLYACANPIDGTPNNPTMSCNSLRSYKHDRTTFSFSTDASAGNGATIAKVVYNFGDGTTETKNNPNDAVTHTYSKPGNYKVTTTVYVNLPGGGTYTIVASGNCATTVTVDQAPIYACTVLQAKALNQTKTDFSFTAQYTARQATLLSATYSLDGDKGVIVKPTAAGVISKNYSFTDNGKHTVVATLNFDVGGTNKTVKCSASVTATQPPKCPVPGKEQYAPDAPECYTPCPTKPSVPVSSETCVTPPPVAPVLPSTGPGDIAAMFAGLVAFGAGAHYIMKRRTQRLQGLAHATVNDNPEVLMSFIAKNNPTQDETLMAEHEFHALHPEASSRTSHHRLIQKTHASNHHANPHIARPHNDTDPK